MPVEDLSKLFLAFTQITWQNIVMMLVGGILIYMAIAKDYEPVLLIPIGFAAIITNFPLTGIADPQANGFL